MTIAWALLSVAWLGLLVVTAAAPDLQNRGALFSLLLPIALISVGSLAVAVIQAYRFAVWIEGTTLTVRQWHGEKRWDLPSTAVVARRSRLVVCLALRDEVSGRRMRLRLRRNRLQNVSALAEAIIAARPGDAGASQAAGALIHQAR